MDRIKNILVPVDFSPCSAAALSQAIRIGRVNRARVSVLHVVDMPTYALPEGAFLSSELPPADLLLSSATERWKKWKEAKSLPDELHFETVLGVPRFEILDRIRRQAIDLLIIGAHAEREPSRTFGPTAAACVQRAATRVMVVREGQAGPFRSVAACVDFSETSRLALEQAVRVAVLDDAALHILHVYGDPWHGVGPPESLREHMPDFGARYRQAVESHLRSFCEPFTHEIRAIRATFHIEEAGAANAGKRIIVFVDRERCDLVVLGTRSVWNLRDFFWGSTAERVVRESACSALTVKPADFQRN